MAWTPTTEFENDWLNFQPGYNFILGDLEYESKIKALQSNTIRSVSTDKNRTSPEKCIMKIEEKPADEAEKIRASLAMMERIQSIAGTKPLGEHASMADWDDESTVEQEAVAMMRHFGMMSMADGNLLPLRPEFIPPPGKQFFLDKDRTVPFIMDPEYFEPGRTRKASSTATKRSLEEYDTVSSMSVNTTADSLNIEKIQENDTGESGQKLLKNTVVVTTKSQHNQKSKKLKTCSWP